MEEDKTMSLRSRTREKKLNLWPLTLTCFPCLMKRYYYFVSLFAFNFLPHSDYRSKGLMVDIIPIGQVISA